MENLGNYDRKIFLDPENSIPHAQAINHARTQLEQDSSITLITLQTNRNRTAIIIHRGRIMDTFIKEFEL